MPEHLQYLVVAAIVSCGVISGLLFAFSIVVMRALQQLPTAVGVLAMQRINVLIINPLFLATFLGSSALCLGVAVIAVRGMPRTWCPIAAGGRRRIPPWAARHHGGVQRSAEQPACQGSATRGRNGVAQVRCRLATVESCSHRTWGGRHCVAGGGAEVHGQRAVASRAPTRARSSQVPLGRHAAPGRTSRSVIPTPEEQRQR